MKHVAVAVLLAMSMFWSSAAADTAEVRDAYRDSASRAMIEENVDGLLTAFSPDIRIQPEYQQTALGPDHAAVYYQAYFDRFDIQGFRKTPEEVIDLGDLVLEIGTFAIEQTLRATGQAYSWEGTYFDIWQQGEGGDARLLTQAWNYNASYEGARGLVHFDDVGGIPAPNMPAIAVTSVLGFEIDALRNYDEYLMTHHQPELMHMIYAEDASYAPHDEPVVHGHEALRQHLADYSQNWPPFSYVDTVTHRLDVSDAGVLEHMSYSLRWIGETETGMSMGKGIRLWKRSAGGQLQAYRQISMHDF